MNNIIVVGSINLDMVFHTQRLPGKGETLLSSSFSTHPGGKGANQALAAQRMSANVRLFGGTGLDEFSNQALQLLTRDGVDLSMVSRQPGQTTGLATITVDDDGNNAIVVYPGANFCLTPQVITSHPDQFSWADAVILQFEILPETVAETVHLAHTQGCRIIVNPAPAREIPADLFPLIDVLIPNEHEIGWLTGLSVHNLTEVETAARTLNQQGAQVVIVTLGEKGALLVEREKPAVQIPAFPVEVVDSVAAGDAFVASFTVAWLEGKTLLESVQFGNAAGALASTHAGAQPSLPWRKEVENLVETLHNTHIS